MNKIALDDALFRRVRAHAGTIVWPGERGHRDRDADVGWARSEAGRQSTPGGDLEPAAKDAYLSGLKLNANADRGRRGTAVCVSCGPDDPTIWLP